MTNHCLLIYFTEHEEGQTFIEVLNKTFLPKVNSTEATGGITAHILQVEHLRAISFIISVHVNFHILQ